MDFSVNPMGTYFYFVLAYSAFWVLVVGFLVLLTKRLSQISRRLDQLETQSKTESAT